MKLGKISCKNVEDIDEVTFYQIITSIDVSSEVWFMQHLNDLGYEVDVDILQKWLENNFAWLHPHLKLIPASSISTRILLQIAGSPFISVSGESSITDKISSLPTVDVVYNPR